MKVIINKTGELVDLPDRDAKRRIQRGQAHPAPKPVKKYVKRKYNKSKRQLDTTEDSKRANKVSTAGYSIYPEPADKPDSTV